MKKALRAFGMNQPERFLFVRSVMPAEMRRALLRPEIAAEVPAQDLAGHMSRHFSGSERGLNAVLRADTLEWLPDDLLMKVDKMTMLASLEARVPFLDYRIVELVSGFPAAWKYRGGRSKVLLKAVAEPILSPEIVNRPKHGFMPPVREWLRGSLKSTMEEHLLDPAARSGEWIDPRATHDLVTRYLAGEDSLYLALWELLCLEVWLRTLESPAAAGTVSARARGGPRRAGGT